MHDKAYIKVNFDIIKTSSYRMTDMMRRLKIGARLLVQLSKVGELKYQGC